MQLQKLGFYLFHEDVTNDVSTIRKFSSALTRGAWPHLQALDIACGNLEEESWRTLLGALINRCGVSGSLQELIFREVTLTDEQVGALADAIATGGLASLKTLSLSYTIVTDLGATLLAKVLHHAPRLEILRLSSTGIGSEGCGALAFAAAVGCPAMKELVFPREIGDEGRTMVKGILSAANRGDSLAVSFW
jgi:hypothetical protein